MFLSNLKNSIYLLYAYKTINIVTSENNYLEINKPNTFINRYRNFLVEYFEINNNKT